MKKIFFSLLISFFSTSPLMAAGDILKLSSDPVKANVMIRDLSGPKSTKIGTTPFEGNLNNLASSYSKSGFFILTVEKDGFESQSIMLSDLFKSDLEMKMTLKPKEEFMAYRVIDKNINQVFEAQRLIRAQQYDDAINLLKNVEKEQDGLSIIPEMIGSAYYLKKDMQAALVWYEKAYRINPDNKDAFTMKAYLRKALGVENAK